MKKALVVIDIQNDYFENGTFPLWNTENTLQNIKEAIRGAENKNIPVIFIRHICETGNSFIEGSKGAEIRNDVLSLVDNATVITKTHADAFYNTNLEEILTKLKIKELLICGMMTQNCIAFTAISKSAEKYYIKIIPECCTTVSEAIHYTALAGLHDRIPFTSINDALFNQE